MEAKQEKAPLPHINTELTHLAVPRAVQAVGTPDGGAGGRGMGWMAALSRFTDVAGPPDWQGSKLSCRAVLFKNSYDTVEFKSRSWNAQ